jgi:hypothetical protein
VNTTPLYFVNRWVDTMIMGGLSIITLMGLLVFANQANIRSISFAAFVASFFVNYPHFSATIYRLYQCPDNVRQFPITAWIIPLILCGAVVACFWQPDTIAPYFVMLYLLWSPYHYSGQTIGLTMVYSRRAGFHIGRHERMALSTFIFSALVFGVVRLQHNIDSPIYGIVPAFPLPSWMGAASLIPMGLGAAVFIWFVFVWCVKQRRLLPPIVLLPAITHFIWFVPGAGVKSFWIIIPFFHSLQYLLVALAMQLKLRTDAPGGEHSWRRIRFETVRWGFRNIVGGLLLFMVLPLLFSWLPLPLLTTTAVIVAAVNIHHFFLDGVIWKLRIAAISSALAMNITELVPSRPGSFTTGKVIEGST